MVAATWKAALEDAKRALEDRNVISALGHLQGAAKKLSSELEDEHRLGSDNGKVKVVHYTSLETIHALLTERSQGLRLYDSVHLTDPQEGWYVFSKSTKSIRTSRWLEYPVSHAYIISFLPLEDDAHDHLSHWRAYGDNGRGCSLVVSVPRSELYEVNYCDRIKNDDAKKLIEFIGVSDRVWNGILRRKKESLHSEYENMIRDSSATVLKSRFLHKHSSYGHERERRALVVTPDKCSIKTEVRGRHIRHYVRNDAFSMDRLLNSDCRITVGPAVDHQGDVAETLKRILDRNGKTGPRIQVSEIPYRTYRTY